MLFYRDMSLYIEPTDLRKDITYIIITNWIRFIILGFVPVTLLVMLYANIHTNLKKRKKRANGKYWIFHFSHTYKINIAAIIAFSMIQIILYILEGKSKTHLRKEEGLESEGTNLIKDDRPNSKLRWKMANVAVTLKTKLNRKKSNKGCNDIIENGDNICTDASAGITG